MRIRALSPGVLAESALGNPERRMPELKIGRERRAAFEEQWLP